MPLKPSLRLHSISMNLPCIRCGFHPPSKSSADWPCTWSAPKPQTPPACFKPIWSAKRPAPSASSPACLFPPACAAPLMDKPKPMKPRAQARSFFATDSTRPRVSFSTRNAPKRKRRLCPAGPRAWRFPPASIGPPWPSLWEPSPRFSWARCLPGLSRAHAHASSFYTPRACTRAFMEKTSPPSKPMNWPKPSPDLRLRAKFACKAKKSSEIHTSEPSLWTHRLETRRRTLSNPSPHPAAHHFIFNPIGQIIEVASGQVPAVETRL